MPVTSRETPTSKYGSAGKSVHLPTHGGIGGGTIPPVPITPARPPVPMIPPEPPVPVLEAGWTPAQAAAPTTNAIRLGKK